MKLITLLFIPVLSHAAAPLKTVMYNASGVQTSCTGGLTTDSSGRVNGCAASSGGASLTLDNTFTGNQYYTNDWVTISTGAYLVYNTSGTNTQNYGDGVLWGQSIDSVSESSGCVVVGWMTGRTSTDTWVFTSSNTADINFFNTGTIPAVLLTNNCAPSSWCQYGTRGFYHVVTDSNGLAAGAFVKSGNTKCQVEGGSALDGASIGHMVGQPKGQNVPATTAFWMILYPGSQ